jgi:hypothetical protein
VFLQFQLSEFAHGKDEAKVIEILRKAWKKMTPSAQAHAVRLELGPREASLLEKSVALHTPA